MTEPSDRPDPDSENEPTGDERPLGVDPALAEAVAPDDVAAAAPEPIHDRTVREPAREEVDQADGDRANTVRDARSDEGDADGEAAPPLDARGDRRASRGAEPRPSVFSRVGFQVALGAAAVAVAYAITYGWPERNGMDLDIDSSARAQEVHAHEPYDLTQLSLLNRVLLQVVEHYVEPDRIEPRRMLLGGLNAVQQEVPAILIDYESGASSLRVTVDTEAETFRVDDVTSPWALSTRFRDIFQFIQDNLDDEDVELREIEEAAVNGMLRTLDPHSLYLDVETYEDMRMSTRGEFGGLGIVISIRDGQLTVIRPMPGTPADRAGVHRRDRIVRIGEESTMNMPLEEAVDRLRGPPGSPVQVWIVREGDGGWTDPRAFTLTRAVIHIESVESRMLGDGIGYISISSFQGNTFADMTRALAQLHANGMRGLVLDLRDDPGGLLDAAVDVADAFLESGTIVTTQSTDPAQREVRPAGADGTEPDYPMIVLINGGSASASEIVAGALKNHNRALIVGERSFGKGSVQVLYDYEDGSALKLTIAQYLTPGDVSIQGVGIMPDIEISPMTVDRADMDLVADPLYLREADLASHLTHSSARTADRPAVSLNYYLPAAERRALREAGPDDDESETEDEFLLRFARQLLASARSSDRRAMIDEARPTIDRVRGEELARAATDLSTLGVDWAEGADDGASTVTVEVTALGPGGQPVGHAGEPLDLRVRVTNTGSAPLYRLRATTHADYGLFNHRELVFGRLAPGETREWTTSLGQCVVENGNETCRLPLDVHDRADGIRIEFEEGHGHAPPPAEVRTTVTGLPRPTFAYATHIADDVHGNGNGVVEPGETATLYLHVRNTGVGPTHDTEANLRSLAGEGVLLRAGRFRIDDIPPGAERTVEFTFEILSDFEEEEAELEFVVIDTDLNETLTERVTVPVTRGGAAPTARTGRVSLRDGTPILERPGGAAFARVEGGATMLTSTAELNGMVRVDLGEDVPGWVAADAIGGRASGGHITTVLDHIAPSIELTGATTVTRDDSITIRGVARDDTVLRDIYVYVGMRKVYYSSNRSSATPTEATFEATLPLRPGINYVVVFARESDESISRRAFVVRRDAADGALMETPPMSDEWFHFGVEGVEGEE